MRRFFAWVVEILNQSPIEIDGIVQHDRKVFNQGFGCSDSPFAMLGWDDVRRISLW